MKAIKSILITLIAFLLSGCYTQLQYSQKMKKVTDNKRNEVHENYRSSDEQANSKNQPESGKAYADYTGEDDDVLIQYKDYEYVQQYAECGCNPYNVYNFYGSSYDMYGSNFYEPYYSYRSHLRLNPFNYPSWYYYRHHYVYPRFGFSLTWGNPHFYHRFHHDPFYDYYYGYGYSSFAYNYYRYHGSFGYGYYYGGNKEKKVDRDSDVRYGPRSVGTNRVVTNSNRSERVRNQSGRKTAVSNKSKTRTRSVGTTRVRDTVNRNTGSTRVKKNRSRKGKGTGSVNARSRSHNKNRDNSSREPVYIDRTGKSEPVVIDRETYNALRSRSVARQNSLNNSNSDNDRNRLQRVRTVQTDRVKERQPTFFKRMKGFFKNNTNRISNTRRLNSTVRSRSSSSSKRSSVSRNKNNSSSRSSVDRSSSSSSNSRSRGGSSSSSSRSRSGGNSDDDSSGSDRSRGN